MVERISCAVCSWEGDSESCPQCGFPISNFRHLLRGDPVLYDEDVRTEFEAEVQKYRAAYEEKRLVLLKYLLALLRQLAQKKADEGSGVQEQQLLTSTVTSVPLPTVQQLISLRQLAAELNSNVARVIASLKSVSDPWRSAFHGFQGGSAEGGSDLVQLIKKLGGADSEVAGLVEQVNSARARRPTVQEALQNEPEQPTEVAYSLGWGAALLILLGILAGIISGSDRGHWHIFQSFYSLFQRRTGCIIGWHM
jgi:hypothetical protein